MASNAPMPDSICTVCLESKELEVFSSCEHSVCSDCLNKSINNAEEEGEKSRCPICAVKSLNLSEDRPSNSTDLISENVNNPMEKTSINKKENGKTQTRYLSRELCTLCNIKGVQVQGFTLCQACSLYMCGRCTDKHATMESNKHHVVIPLPFQKRDGEDICHSHGIAKTRFCQACLTAMCSVCVFEEHEDHTVKSLADVIDTKLTGVKHMLGKLKAVLKRCQEGRDQLLQLIAQAKEGDREAVIDEAIEKQAGKVMKAFQEWKVATKRDLKEKFKVIPEMESPLVEYTKSIQDLQVSTMEASRTVLKVEKNQKYLEELTGIMEDLQSRLDGAAEQVDISIITKRVENLIEGDFCFLKKQIPQTFGGAVKFDDSEFTEFKPQQIEEHTIHGYPDGTNIYYISMISYKLYVVSLSNDSKTYFIHIYDMTSNALKHKFKVKYLRGMAATPYDKVAMILKQQGGGHVINVYNPETGVIDKVIHLKLSMEATSMAINYNHQFVILCSDGSKGQISVVEVNGDVLTTHGIADDDLMKSNKTACGGKYIFISGRSGHIGVYELACDKIKYVKTLCTWMIYDITAKPTGTFYTADVNSLARGKRKRSSDWDLSFWNHRRVTETKQITITTRDGYNILVGDGKTVRLFKTF